MEITPYYDIVKVRGESQWKKLDNLSYIDLNEEELNRRYPGAGNSVSLLLEGKSETDPPLYSGTKLAISHCPELVEGWEGARRPEGLAKPQAK
jgi:hypothetical protein